MKNHIFMYFFGFIWKLIEFWGPVWWSCGDSSVRCRFARLCYLQLNLYLFLLILNNLNHFALVFLLPLMFLTSSLLIGIFFFLTVVFFAIFFYQFEEVVYNSGCLIVFSHEETDAQRVLIISFLLLIWFYLIFEYSWIYLFGEQWFCGDIIQIR